jgi:hypothetical protein
MKKWIYFLVAWFLYMIIHEGVHAFTALIEGEFKTILVHWYGPEVVYKSQVSERMPGIKWTLISGLSGIITVLSGYILFGMKNRIYAIKNTDLKGILYLVTIAFLLIDPLYFSILTSLIGGGGDVTGIAVGLGTHKWIIQVFFGIVFIINRELIADFILKSGVKTKHFLFRPWLKR